MQVLTWTFRVRHKEGEWVGRCHSKHPCQLTTWLNVFAEMADNLDRFLQNNNIGPDHPVTTESTSGQVDDAKLICIIGKDTLNRSFWRTPLDWYWEPLKKGGKHNG